MRRLFRRAHSIINSDNIWNHFFWGIYLYIMYKLWIFIPIDGFSAELSALILFLLMLAGVLFGLYLRRRSETESGGFLDSCVGMGIYSVMVYKDYYSGIISALMLTFLLLSLTYAVLIFMMKNRGRRLHNISDSVKRRHIILTRLRKTATAMVTIFGISMAVLIFNISYNSVVHGGIMAAKTIDASSVTEDSEEAAAWEQFSLKNNIEKIAKIGRKELWDELSLDDKLEVLRNIAYSEVYNLGLYSPVNLVLSYENYYKYGSYDRENNRVILNIDHVRDDEPGIILDTLLHEMYHIYEYELTDLFNEVSGRYKRLKPFRSCESYMKEMQNYEHGGSGDAEQYMRYYTQDMEEDSRFYAEYMSDIYLAEINRYYRQ
ncbi:MAG: hypothetical protein MJ131_11240 [Lachnospiraceae bacterium]|nr:hypothetical protein [Lachnospiraceae bacterium]